MDTFHDILQPGCHSGSSFQPGAQAGGSFQPGAQAGGSFHDLPGPGVDDSGGSFQPPPMRGRGGHRPPRGTSRGRGGRRGGRSGKAGTSTCRPGHRGGDNNIPPPNVLVWSYSVDENVMSSFCSLQLLVWFAIFVVVM